MDNEIIHDSVLVEEILSFFAPDAEKSVLIDATLGEGGHSEVFLKHFPFVQIYGIERDAEILQIAKKRLIDFEDRITFFNLTFTEFFTSYKSLPIKRPDWILFDLGISKYHYVKSGRGFSFSREEPLDMRLDSKLEISAADIVNQFSEKEMAQIFFDLGEERFSRKIAKRIADNRVKNKIKSSLELAELIKEVVPRKANTKIHPATRCFQALRIYVNQELENLEKVLVNSFELLNPGGRMAVIAYHSLEDRIVKNFFREKNRTCVCPPELPICKCDGIRELELVTRKPVFPGYGEVDRNHAARSARLRVIEKL